ncbi:hypothetical protein FA15DRAFT_710270 [Coprinopsis marcescibilis]|uniref:Uncharacterized protein n=1 Tax=Coprinopsis marcescibilis TaxID=230819 RepID=A0A5C3KDF3_COPMA|nr:hypothetical protein FA15DRAFT_710270 [Coprinopsis marcescibilis]
MPPVRFCDAPVGPGIVTSVPLLNRLETRSCDFLDDCQIYNGIELLPEIREISLSDPLALTADSMVGRIVGFFERRRESLRGRSNGGASIILRVKSVGDAGQIDVLRSSLAVLGITLEVGVPSQSEGYQ